MRFLFSLWVCAFGFSTLQAQTSEIKLTPEQGKKIAAEVCKECFANTDKNGQDLEMCLGLSMFKQGSQMGLFKDVAMSRETGEKLGAQVGIYLMQECPNFIDYVTKKMENPSKEKFSFVSTIFFSTMMLNK